ncbi:MAG: F0F1 ATP synthase subunit B [Coriobacteriia bacterium]|nr:F0F1 ATP synthase subunit B [Coriobacteriia bacterium]
MKQRIKTVAKMSVLLTTAMLAMPAMAFAAEDGDAKLGIELLFPPLGEFIPMLIGFIILWIILAKLAWPHFIGMIDKRAEKIKDSLEKAEFAKQEAERLLEEYKVEISGAKKEAADIIANAKQQAEHVKAEITASAQTEAESIISKARRAIETEKKTAIAELQASAADMTIMVTKKVIGTDLSTAEHKSIIERYIAEAGSFNEN